MANSELNTGTSVNTPRVVISACQGHMGKTTVSTGICAALREQGQVIQPFKKGPDYIDPSWLGAAAHRPCRNLDAFMMSEEYLLRSFGTACQDADFALVEGVMGLYDSFDVGGMGSTAWISRLLGAPVILVINASRMTRSVAAMLYGFQNFEQETKIAGVILNNVALRGHRKRLEHAIERYCHIPVVGCLPHCHNLMMDEQHLGLLPYGSTDNADSVITHISRMIKKHVDLKMVLAIAQMCDAINVPSTKILKIKTPCIKIGVLRDKAFCFYYPENLDALRDSGAELVFIDSLSDRELPAIDGLYLGGGFPELFAKELEANTKLRLQILRKVNSGLPVYAECAGLMYLCRELYWQGNQYEMVGALPYSVEMCPETQGHGYVVAEVKEDNPWFPKGLEIRGHQFHHSRLTQADSARYSLYLKRRRKRDTDRDGIVQQNIFAAYTHIHASSVPGWAEAFVSLAFQGKKAIKDFPVTRM